MWIRAVVVALIIALSGSEGRAQGLPVFDLSLIFHMTEQVLRARAAEILAREHNETLRRMGIRLPGMDRFRIPGLPLPGHDSGRYIYAQPILDALNSGDARATQYYDVVRVLSRDVGLFDQLPEAARRAMRAAYATVEILDSTSHQAVHQAGATRLYTGVLGEEVDRIQDIVTGGDPAAHEVTAILDTIALSKLTQDRQNTAITQLQANVLSQRLAQAKATRDAHAAHLSMTIETIRDRGDLSHSTVVNATDVLRNWSLP